MMKSDIQLNMKILSDMDSAEENCCEEVFAIIEIVDGDGDDSSWYEPALVGDGTLSLLLAYLLTLSYLLTYLQRQDMLTLLVNAMVCLITMLPQGHG